MNCPGCTAGEHHPTHDVTTISLAGGTEWCTCPCAVIMTRQAPPYTPGDRAPIEQGRYAGQTLTVHEYRPREGTYIGVVLDYISRPKVVHIMQHYVRENRYWKLLQSLLLLVLLYGKCDDVKVVYKSM